MDSAVKRPWYRLHWVTWVVVVVVIAALVARQVERHFGIGASSFGYTNWWYAGWPILHVEIEESGITVPSPGDPPPTFKYNWRWIGVLVNLTVCILVAASAAAVLETWLRRSRQLQINLRHFLLITAVVAVMLGLAVHGETFSFDQLTTFRWPRPSSISWEDFRRPLRWPLLFGVACTIYSLGWLALAILTRAYRLVRP